MPSHQPESLKLELLKPTEELRNLQLLEEISKESKTSQRKLARHLGVALGVTNACLKKMVKKGYIKAKGINHKRISYYITPKGFTEKTRLTYHFLQYTIKYYIDLKNNIASKLNSISRRGIKRIVYYGAGEVMEVALITLHETNLELVGIVDDAADKQGKRIFGFTIQDSQIIKQLNPEAVLVTSIRYKDEILRNLNKNKELEGIAFYSL